MENNFKNLFLEVPEEKRGEAIDLLVEVTGATRLTVVTNWTSPYKGYNCPKRHRDKCIQALQNFHKQLNLKN